MVKLPDIDIDFANRDDILDKLEDLISKGVSTSLS